MSVEGQQLIADCWGCDAGMTDAAGARGAIAAAVDAMGATLLDLRLHEFDSGCYTALALLSESHLAIHRWPEHGYVAIDTFTCGVHVRPAAGIEVLLAFFAPRQSEVRQVARGIRPGQRAETADDSASKPVSAKAAGCDE